MFLTPRRKPALIIVLPQHTAAFLLFPYTQIQTSLERHFRIKYCARYPLKGELGLANWEDDISVNGEYGEKPLFKLSSTSS